MSSAESYAQIYLPVLGAILTYKLLCCITPMVGRWVHFKLPRLHKDWQYNLNGDLCAWDGRSYTRTVIKKEVLYFFGIKE